MDDIGCFVSRIFTDPDGHGSWYPKKANADGTLMIIKDTCFDTFLDQFPSNRDSTQTNKPMIMAEFMKKAKVAGLWMIEKTRSESEQKKSVKTKWILNDLDTIRVEFKNRYKCDPDKESDMYNDEYPFLPENSVETQDEEQEQEVFYIIVLEYIIFNAIIINKTTFGFPS